MHTIIFLPSEAETRNTTLCLAINTNSYIAIQIIDFLFHRVFSFIPGYHPLLFCINLILGCRCCPVTKLPFSTTIPSTQEHQWDTEHTQPWLKISLPIELKIRLTCQSHNYLGWVGLAASKLDAVRACPCHSEFFHCHMGSALHEIVSHWSAARLFMLWGWLTMK